MRRIVSLLALIVCLSTTASAQNEQTPPSRLLDLPAVVAYQLVTPNMDSLALADADEVGQNLPVRFGVEIRTDKNIMEVGTINNLPDGGRIIRYSLRAPSARSLNFIFDDFYLPPGAKFYVYTANYQHVAGPFDARKNREDLSFAVPPTPGDEITFELYEPANAIAESKARLKSTIFGYKSVFFKSAQDYLDSESCNNNVNCSVGANWQDEKKGVALILLSNGTRICTGSLINNVRQDGTPYFLTANHCTDASTSTWIFLFNYESPTCTNADGPLTDWVQGCVTRSTWTGSDFTLLELNERPQDFYDVYYNGFSASSTAPTNTIGIHHPSGDIKKISFDDNAAGSATWASVTNGHWSVSWNDGVTEPGSSGSPLFNQNSQIIGTLSGGGSSCSNPTSTDYYGKVSVDWAGNGSNTTRLSNWLDPDNTGTTIINGTSPNGCNIATSISGTNAVCSGVSSVLTSAVTNNTGTISYAWAPSTGLSSTTSANVTATPSATTVYTLTVTDAEACSTTALFTLTVNAAPSATLSAALSGGSAATKFCSNGGNANLSATVSGSAVTGGTFTGTGVSGTVFNPATAGVGNHVITYTGSTPTNTVGTNTSSALIPDNTCAVGTGVSSLITIAGFTGTLSAAQAAQISVQFNITHTWCRDLSISLTSPDGAKTLLLFYRTGADNSVNLTNTVVSDAATVEFAAGAAPWTGTFLPDAQLGNACGRTTNITTFADFAGTSANGNWTLYVSDAAVDDEGTLVNWTITLPPASTCPARGTTTLQVVAPPSATASTTPATSGQSNGSVTVNATGGATPYQYNINGGTFQSSNVFSNLAAGTYTLTVRDFNGCTAITSATITSTTAVWPGDADADGDCDRTDFFVTANANGRSGPARSQTGTIWQAYTAPAVWGTSNNVRNITVNHFHSDANGDGVVNLFDVATTLTNRGLTH